MNSFLPVRAKDLSAPLYIILDAFLDVINSIKRPKEVRIVTGLDNTSILICTAYWKKSLSHL